MRRRQFLHALPTTAGLVAVAGCLGDDSDDGSSTTAPPTDSPSSTDNGTNTTSGDGPAGVYVQSFQEGMAMFSPVTKGDYTFALMLAVPHTFWTVTGTDRTKQEKSDEQTAHVMAQVWHEPTKQVLADTDMSIEILKDGDLVSEEVIYPMLSQRMGFHYGGNFTLSGDGDYIAKLSVGKLGIGRLGNYADLFGSPATAEVEFALNDQTRSKITTKDLPSAGDKGAIKPMESMMMPVGIAAEAKALPGTTVGTKRVDDADLVTKYVNGGRFAASGKSYLYVSARTPYNDLVLPMMGLDATVTRGGETVFEGQLSRAIDHEAGYHYGVETDALQSGDEVTLSVVTPPQVARHEGYETAFLQMDGGATLTL
ncbi:DUF7350 domain-containing protein [Haloarchaeobius sp. DFWS5]|uniref:DUF7350 domain-containing protein n=1 Tax=Haloarchaeobius sp. DFWS5 TaxID=3446114 RepID=UPI003EBCB6CC